MMRAQMFSETPFTGLTVDFWFLHASHLYRMWTDYLGWRVDVSVAQMILTAKLCQFAFNYADGQALKAGKVCLRLGFAPFCVELGMG
jgi:hypothetical protein